jgi:hypothetical protein
MGAHLIDGEFQSYPTTPRGKVPLSVKDVTAQDLLWEYAQRRRAVDAEFADDLETALRAAGFVPAGESSTSRCSGCAATVDARREAGGGPRVLAVWAGGHAFAPDATSSLCGRAWRCRP